MNSLAHKNVIVTGATSGIGEAIARRFCEEGSSVALVGRRKELGEAIARDITKQGCTAFFVQADVTDSESVEAMSKACLEKFGGEVSELVNNAGISSGNAPTEYVAEEDWDRVTDTNSKGTYLCSKAIIPSMVKNGGGSIVNVSSAGGLKGYVGGAAYASSKAAAIMLTKVLAMEHGKDKIRTNCICPGSIRTEMFEAPIKNFAKRQGAQNADQIIQNIAKAIPLGRIANPERLPAWRPFSLRRKPSFINGAVIVIDGGQTL